MPTFRVDPALTTPALEREAPAVWAEVMSQLAAGRPPSTPRLRSLVQIYGVPLTAGARSYVASKLAKGPRGRRVGDERPAADPLDALYLWEVFYAGFHVLGRDPVPRVLKNGKTVTDYTLKDPPGENAYKAVALVLRRKPSHVKRLVAEGRKMIREGDI